MRLLLDTHTFLWWTTEDPQLSLRASELIADGHNQLFLSVVSIWEITIKAAKGKLILPEEPASYLTNRMGLYRIVPLPIQMNHALHVYSLPTYHVDPFDRLLVAQSQIESLVLVSKDEQIRRYAVEVIW
jgi:PIN domain nuclease of toxin-antitoxin system